MATDGLETQGVRASADPCLYWLGYFMKSENDSNEMQMQIYFP